MTSWARGRGWRSRSAVGLPAVRTSSSCPVCRSRFGRPAFAVHQPGLSVPVWATARYEGETASVVRAWKDGGRLDLGVVLGAALAGAVRAALVDRAVMRTVGLVGLVGRVGGPGTGGAGAIPAPSGVATG